jgi:hypothetical protein
MKAWENLTEEDYKDLKRILETIYNNLNVKADEELKIKS